MIEYTEFLTRILEILKSNKEFSDKISEFRFGDIGDNKDKMLNANSYPLCFVTTAANPEVSRDSIFSQGDVGKIPGQKRVLEFWVIIVADGPTSEYTQKSLYSLVGMALDILENNQQLRNSEGADNLCSASDIFTQKRLETNRGKLLEAMTIRVRPTIFIKR